MMAVGGTCACSTHRLVRGPESIAQSSPQPLPRLAEGQADLQHLNRRGRSEPRWAPTLFSSLREDLGASTICQKGPSTILLPLQEALNNCINLPKYGKKRKPLQTRDTWQVFRLHIFPLARPPVRWGSCCYLKCFL